MGDIIRDWLRTRLGVIIDLSPEIFGRYARDGTLLGKLLHSYDIINDSQLNTLLHTHDPALARVNLKHLRVWLHFIGVDCDLECIEDISNGKGTTSLRLFYKVFLCLENKDRLHFITLQNEREKYIPSSSKFDVTTVSEEPEVPQESDVHPLADPLKKNFSLLDWERKKHGALIDTCKKDREKFRASQQVENEIEKRTSGVEGRSISVNRRRAMSLMKEAEKRELDEFARRHRVNKSQKPEDPCEDVVRPLSSRKSKIPIDHDAARAYTKSLKSKHRQQELTRSFKTRLQKTLLTELWEKVLDDQEMEFDEIVAKKVLHQSQYEKQMMRKLYEVRNQKMRMAENREIVEELLEKTRENEMRLEQERAREILIRENEEVEAENQRMNELERRIEEQKMRRKREVLEKFGEEMVNDLIDISIKEGEYKISSEEDSVPKSLLNEWKALFFKNQPIFDAADQFEASRDDYGEEEICEGVEEEDETRTEVLNEEDFENYHNMRLPWEDFIPSVDMENREYLNLGLIVLGYIVHKILESLDPNDRETFQEPVPRMKIRAAILDLPGTLLYEPIQELLQNKKIHLVRLEEAINHCLECYKEEMKDFEYIDLEIIAAGRQTLNSLASDSGERGKRVQKKSPLNRAKTFSPAQKIEATKSGIDKVTQTPRIIPHDDLDPSLSDTAYIGKWTHEFLTLGQPISDELTARIIVEYLKSLCDHEGFILVNYPTTYSQSSLLEFALGGRKLPNRDDKFSNARDEICIEEIDPVPSRIIFGDEENDSLALWMRSRLVPNPIENFECSQGNTYFTAFVRLKPKPQDLEYKKDDDTWEIMGDDATSIDAFYVEQEIASILYYANFDLTTLKSLVRLIITRRNETISRVSSGELFGKALKRFEGHGEDDSSSSKAPVIKRLLSRPVTVSSHGESQISEWIGSREENDGEPGISTRSADPPPLPGEAEWSWANFPQHQKLIESLRNLWQNLENSYIENLKNLFNLKRRNYQGQVPYKNFVTRHMREFIERPDKKQDLLHEFHRAFNDIDEDIRDDEEAKRELHCRIDDFQTRLWEICDSRRREAEDERTRIIMENWTSVEMIILANVYIGILQTELDRTNDTLQFIQDYYDSMYQRPLQDIRTNVILKKIKLENQTLGFRQEDILMTKASIRSIKMKESKELRQKASSSKISPAPSAPDENLFVEETAKFLSNVNEENFFPAQTTCYKTIEANIRYVETVLDFMASPILNILKKEETSVAKSLVDVKEKKGSSRIASPSSGVDQLNAKKRIQDLILEWRYAIMFELNRIRFRLKMLEAAAISDIDFLIEGMRRVFFGIERNIIDRYEREVRSVNEMASTFRFAVEEATPIQEELLLDADRFIVRSNVLMFPDKPEAGPSPIHEEISPSRFKIGQLARLMDIFRRLSPSGNLPERSFVYVIQDLIVCDEEQEYSMLPASWLELRACDVPKIVDELFPDDEFIDWREFLIYAMEIEPPSVDQLLDVLASFRTIDEKFEQFVSWDEFRNVVLWFFDGRESDIPPSNWDMHENFEQDGEDIHEEEMLEKCDWALGTESSENMTDGRKMKPEETMRLAMVKKLLCEMFSENCQRVNYLALLMIFCKDLKPEIGLGKALSLAIGNKVCMDWTEGEEYVRKLVEGKTCAVEARSSRNNLRDEATKISGIILNSLMEDICETSQETDSNTIEHVELTPDNDENDRRSSIRIERLDSPGESVDPVDLLRSQDKTSSSSMSDVASSDGTPESKSSHCLSVTISLPKGDETKKYSRTEKRVNIYWLSLDICQSVLAAMLPSHAIQADVLESGRSLRDNLNLICLDLRDENLNDEADVILAHRFINHDFVRKLLAETSKFTMKHLGKIVDKIIRNNKLSYKMSL